MEHVTISVYRQNNHFSIKLQSKAWELNIRMKDEEFYSLENIRSAVWSERNSIEAGTSANSHVFWVFQKESETVSILVGQDDESWDFGVSFPIEQIECLITKFVNDKSLKYSNNLEV